MQQHTPPSPPRGTPDQHPDIPVSGGPVDVEIPENYGFITVRPAAFGIDLIHWLENNKRELSTFLLTNGAVLFRGFDTCAHTRLKDFARLVSPRFSETYGDLPRSGEGYSPTRYPGRAPILFHNESAHMPTHPSTLFFQCIAPATSGGETRIVDGRQVYDALSVESRQRLRCGFRYTRNFHPGLDLPWQQVFGTDDREQVAVSCTQSGARFEWSGDRLRIVTEVPAIISHPTTGERAFFSQLQLFHPDFLGIDVADTLRNLYADNDLPRMVEHSDGGAVSTGLVAEISALYERFAEVVAWQRGDILVLDNLMKAHARSPYEGARELAIVLGEMRSAAARHGIAESESKWSPPLAVSVAARSDTGEAIQFPDVCELIHARVCTDPGAAAVRSGGKTFSYARLWDQAKAIARRLEDRQVPPGGSVAITGKRGFNLVAAVIAVLMVGGVFSLIDPLLPARRRSALLRRAGAGHLVFVDINPNWGDENTEVIVISGQMVNEPPPAPEERWQDFTGLPDCPAYVVFTSGSTAVPKRVTGTRNGLAHFIDWQRTTYCIGVNDRVAQLTGLSFDVILRDMFLPLCSGGVLHIPDEQDEYGPVRVLEWLWRERVTVLHAVPSLTRWWLSDADSGFELPDLRLTFFAGEALDSDLVAAWRQVSGGDVVNLYGPTETTLAKLVYPVPDPCPPGRVPIGRPMPGAQVTVINEHGGLCETGEVGEVVIGTPYRCILDHEQPADGLYRTGDLGCLRANGDMHFVGRKDDQVKINGVRVNPQEVADVLGGHTDVHQCFVDATRSGDTPAFLTAYVAAAAGRPEPQQLLRFAASRLPVAMLPRHIVCINSLPLTPNGKVDRAALRLSRPQCEGRTTGSTLPASEAEFRIAEIWSDLLGLARIDTESDFFACGGDSLLAVQAVGRIHDAFGVWIPLEKYFDNPTVAALGELVREAPARASAAVAPIRPRPPRIPLSSSQRRFWFLNQLDPGSGLYNMPIAFRMTGMLSLPALRKTLDHLIRRHEILRTCFPLDGHQPVQLIHERAVPDIERHDLIELGAVRQHQRLFELAEQLIARPFDLVNGSLLRFSLVKLGAESHVLLAAMHHIVGDGWTTDLLQREFTRLYDTCARGNIPELPVPAQYADYAVREQAMQQAEAYTRQLQYWKNALENIPPLFDIATGSAGGTGTDPVCLSLSPDFHTQAIRTARRQRCTLSMLLLAAYQLTLAAASGRRDIAVAAPVANRSAGETETTLGCFINLVVLRARLEMDPSLDDFLQQTRRTVIDAMSNQDVPFDTLANKLRPIRRAGRIPFAQVMYNFVSFGRQPEKSGCLDITRAWFTDLKSGFDIALYAREHDGQLALRFVFDTQLFDTGFTQGFVQDYLAILNMMVQGRQERSESLLQHLRQVKFSCSSPATRDPLPGVPSRRLSLTDTEAGLIAIWEKFLGVPAVGVNDNFFELGGHSLMASEIVAEIQDVLRKPATLKMFFEGPTVAGLAATLETNTDAREHPVAANRERGFI